MLIWHLTQPESIFSMHSPVHSPIKVIFACTTRHPGEPPISCGIYFPAPGEAGKVSFEDPKVVESLITITGPNRDSDTNKFYGKLDVYKIEAQTEILEINFRLSVETKKEYPSIRLSSTFGYNDEPKYGPLSSGEAVSLKMFLLSDNVDAS